MRTTIDRVNQGCYTIIELQYTKERIMDMEAIGYIRVSTLDQSESGLGLADQEKRIRSYCVSQGLELVDVYVDAGVSAKTLDREGLRGALGALCPGRILVALKLDRLTRTARDLDDFTGMVKSRGGEWATVEGNYDTSSAMGNLILRIVAAIAQMEREVTAERVVAALGVKKSRGERLGTTPLGYRTVDGVVEEDEVEQATVKLARDLRDKGLSLRGIASELTKGGHRTKRGGLWQSGNVFRLMEPRYLERCVN